MKRPLLLRGFLESWYAKSFYADVGLAGRGLGLLYLLGVCLVLQLPTTVQVAIAVHQWSVHDAPRYVNQLPTIAIHAGHASTTAPTPYVVEDPDSHRPWLIIDPKGHLSELPTGYPAVMLTDSQLIMRRSAVETRMFQLANVPDMTIDAASVTRFLNWLMLAVPPLVYLFGVAFRWAWNLGFALLLAGLGVLVVRNRPHRLPYGTLVRLAVVALTPLLVFETVLEAVNLHVPFGWWRAILVGGFYTYLAITAVEEAMRAPAAEPVPVVSGDAAV